MSDGQKNPPDQGHPLPPFHHHLSKVQSISAKRKARAKVKLCTFSRALKAKLAQLHPPDALSIAHFNPKFPSGGPLSCAVHRYAVSIVQRAHRHCCRRPTAMRSPSSDVVLRHAQSISAWYPLRWRHRSATLGSPSSCAVHCCGGFRNPGVTLSWMWIWIAAKLRFM
jgi:hypothetical protein